MRDEMSNSIDELVKRHQKLSIRRDSLVTQKSHIEAELAARKRNLKKHMDAAREAGLDPNNIRQEVHHLNQVMRVKLDTYESDIEAAEKLLRPMVDDINKS
jgi:hypothetical protein